MLHFFVVVDLKNKDKKNQQQHKKFSLHLESYRCKRTLSDMDELTPVRSVNYGPPRPALRNKGTVNSLKANLVPVVTQVCQVVALRCMFDAKNEEEAKRQIAARRRQLEKKALEHPEVRIYSSNRLRQGK